MQQVKNTTNRLICIGMRAPAPALRLLPGVNEVDPGVWVTAKDIKVVQHWIDAGELVDLGVGAISKMSADSAKKLILETYDESLLEKWAAEDTRPVVQKTIMAQAAKMEKLSPVKQAEDKKE